MKTWLPWILLAVAILVFLYIEERRERFRLLVWAKTFLRRERMRLQTWAADQQAQRAEQAQLENGQKESKVILGFQQPALS